MSKFNHFLHIIYLFNKNIPTLLLFISINIIKMYMFVWIEYLLGNIPCICLCG